MAKYHRFTVWKLALANLADIATDVKALRGEADLRDQIKRAGRSVVVNFCEGSGARSDAEFARYVGIARPSNTELQAWYEILGATGSISNERLEQMIDRIDHVGRSLSRLLVRLAGSG